MGLWREKVGAGDWSNVHNKDFLLNESATLVFYPGTVYACVLHTTRYIFPKPLHTASTAPGLE